MSEVDIEQRPWIENKEVALRRARKYDLAVRLYTKDNWFCSLLAFLLHPIDATARAAFLDLYATTVGPLQFYPRHWPLKSVTTVLPHEGRHVKHARWLGLWTHPWVGLLPYALLYLLIPLPVLFAWCRALFERDALYHELLEGRKNGIYTPLQAHSRAIQFAISVTSSGYLWTIPKSWCISLYTKTAQRAIDEFTRREASSEG